MAIKIKQLERTGKIIGFDEGARQWFIARLQAIEIAELDKEEIIEVMDLLLPEREGAGTT